MEPETTIRLDPENVSPSNPEREARSMTINDAPPSKRQSATLKEIRVKLPIRQHVLLYRTKLFLNRSMGAVVTEALDEWFARHLVDEPRTRPHAR